MAAQDPKYAINYTGGGTDQARANTLTSLGQVSVSGAHWLIQVQKERFGLPPDGAQAPQNYGYDLAEVEIPALAKLTPQHGSRTGPR